MKIKLNVSTLALFAALNFTLVDLSGSTFVYAPQNITVVDHDCNETVSVDADENLAQGTFKVTLDDGCSLIKEIEVTFSANLDMDYIEASKGDEAGFELRGVDDIEISVLGTHLVDNNKRYPTKYELSEHQIAIIKELAAQEIGSLSTVDGVILDDARDWYVCD